ncbi:MAG: hypothetical protein WCD66_04630 [Rhodanobacteraceae bacterium]
MRDPGTPSRHSVVLCWLAAAAGMALATSVFWPGMVSHDAAVMWEQARGGEMDTIHSPALTLVWRALEGLHDSPADIFLLHLAMFWGALALLATTLPRATGFRISWLVVVGLVPPTWVLMAQVGTDAGLVAALSLACACLVRANVSGQRGWLLAALLMCLYGAAMRHNALPALLPLLWVCWSGKRTSGVMARASLTLASLALIGLATVAINTSAPRQRAVWPATAMWDLAAISIARDKVLLPEASVGPGMSVDDLAQAFEPWANTTLFARTRSGVRSPFLKPDQGQLKSDIARAWWHAVVSHPGAYARHRWRLTRALFGTHPSDWPVELIYFPRQNHVGDNPALAARTNPWQRLWFRWLDQWRRTALLAAWPWLLAGIPALLLGWRRRASIHGRMSLVLVASGWLLALPLLIAAPAAELRYLAWPISASIMALGLALASRDSARLTRHDPARESLP